MWWWQRDRRGDWYLSDTGGVWGIKGIRWRRGIAGVEDPESGSAGAGRYDAETGRDTGNA